MPTAKRKKASATASVSRGQPLIRSLELSATLVQNVKVSVSIATAPDSLDSMLDSMSELGETESLRLQMAMDRLSKLMITLSNILLKIGDTNSSILQNLK